MDFESNITSYNLDMNVYKNNPRSFDELFYYLDKKSKNSSQILSNNIYLSNTRTLQLVSKPNLFSTSLTLSESALDIVKLVLSSLLIASITIGLALIVGLLLINWVLSLIIAFIFSFLYLYFYYAKHTH